jgi:hypothetical protein
VNVVQCCLTQIESARARDLVTSIGADDGIRVWVNGDEILRQNAPVSPSMTGAPSRRVKC